MGLGMAMTSGVSMNDWASDGTVAGWPASARRWSTTAPQALLDGDQMVGLGPSAASSGQPRARLVAAAPDDTVFTFTNAQPPAPAFLAVADELNSAASVVMRSSFSGETVTWTTAHPLGASPPAWPPALPPTQAVASRA